MIEISGMQAALILWTAGTAAMAPVGVRAVKRMVNADPMELCDECREKRRDFMVTSAPMGSYLLALVVLLAAALASITVPPIWTYRKITGKKRHRCRPDAA